MPTLDYLNQHPGIIGLFVALVIWTLIWKGLALWKAAQKRDKVWFVALLLINTAGILEMFYIFAFSNRQQEHQDTQI